MEDSGALAPIAMLIALELVHLRWIVWTQWHCRRCHASHADCACKPAWLKLLL